MKEFFFVRPKMSRMCLFLLELKGFKPGSLDPTLFTKICMPSWRRLPSLGSNVVVGIGSLGLEGGALRQDWSLQKKRHIRDILGRTKIFSVMIFLS